MKKAIIILVFISLTWACGHHKETAGQAPGVVDGDVITLKSQAAGAVEQFKAVEGQQTAPGDLLVKINSDKIQNQRSELDITLKEIENNSGKLREKARFLRSSLAYLGKQVQRFQRLKKTGAVPGEKLEAMELKKLEAQTSLADISRGLRALELQQEKIQTKAEYLDLVLADHTVTAPVAGVVLETFVSKGETVMPGTPLADILDTDSLFVETFLEEPELAALKLGMKARIQVDGMEGKELWGTISYFGRKAEFSPKYIISEKERTALLYRVKIRVDGVSGIFKLGMPVTVEFGEGAQNDG